MRLGGQSEVWPMRHMINERTQMEVRQDLSLSSEASESPQRLRIEMNSGLALPLLRSLNPPSLPPAALCRVHCLLAYFQHV